LALFQATQLRHRRKIWLRWVTKLRRLILLTSDVLDLSEDVDVCSAAFYLLGRNRAVSGRIRTVRCFEDNALIKIAMMEASQGEVLVIDGGGSLRTALMGDQIVGAGLASGWAGAIVFGAIRDRAAIDALDFHVKALGTNPRKSSKSGVGERDVVIEVGGVRFAPGWFLYSDDDGVVIVAEPVSSP
jgi:regulator of ribonuclease activity A